ncbi:hypothetical protein MNEG_12034 [Monoraphidium neglectum]|uniref:Uncharacterized protein n=1 Tax=Monoraphidium neglectum TaxID=145388 RepID=A0A0D2MM82_9CHLO|nr:hypothetical protein MNEG_12034 [Monoraphidium neglectum]KIY95930.1 hypothetical protein MNEG_12034 [Monoraphidium neglectum]|eukprot:XP_013894950.1 hypothetical protein MNEG_12034 [Monoraphidium neglectum]
MGLISLIWFVLKPLGLVVGLILLFTSFGFYALFQSLCGVWFKTQNLKKRYNAEWALVTGSSSGIGKAIAQKLAQQGLNVVLVALADDLLDRTHEELSAAYPGVEFRKVGANLGKSGYMAEITRATSDINVQVVFCNAGYILSGFFYTR